MVHLLPLQNIRNMPQHTPMSRKLIAESVQVCSRLLYKRDVGVTMLTMVGAPTSGHYLGCRWRCNTGPSVSARWQLMRVVHGQQTAVIVPWYEFWEASCIGSSGHWTCKRACTQVLVHLPGSCVPSTHPLCSFPLQNIDEKAARCGSLCTGQLHVKELVGMYSAIHIACLTAQMNAAQVVVTLHCQYRSGIMRQLTSDNA